MTRLVVLLLSASIVLSTGYSVAYNGSTTAAVVVAGSILKSKNNHPVDTKYKRKDCPVCKGKGWYMSGDGIEKIPCQYCEPEKEDIVPEKTDTITPSIPRSPRIFRR